jgi:hypothetical protein
MSVNMIKILMSLCESATCRAGLRLQEPRQGRQRESKSKAKPASRRVSQVIPTLISISNLCIEFKFKQINRSEGTRATGSSRLL